MENKFKIDTYPDIESLTHKELMTRIERDFGFETKYPATIIQQHNLMRRLFKTLGLTVNNEQSMLVMLNNKRLLCEAGAGSGKTTMTQLRMVRFKLFEQIRGYDILCLAYNDHACNDMVNKHKEIIQRINEMKVKGIYLDSEIYCKTFHSYALTWVEQFKGLLGIKSPKIQIMNDLDQQLLMQKALTSALKKTEYNLSTPNDTTAKSLLLFYSVVKEGCLTVDTYNTLPQFKRLPIQDPNIVEDIFKRYDKVKKVKSIFDFSDILTLFYKLLSEDTQAREQIQNAYKVVLADEYQDFTTIMRRCLALMISPETYLTCVGDGDQSIYNFRGTDSLNCVKFREEFNNTVIVSMSVNRRCRDNILKTAKSVIEINKLRNDKNIISIKEGGDVNHFYWYKRQEQADALCKALASMNKEDLTKTCICYRNKDSSYMLTYALLKAGVPFRVGSGYKPFTDLLDKSLMEFIELIRNPRSKKNIKKCLFKYLPGISRGDLEQIVDNSEEEDLAFWEYDFNRYSNINRFNTTLSDLRIISGEPKKGKPMSEYMPRAIQYLEYYYWNLQKKYRNFTPETEEYIKSQYTQDLTLSEFLSQKENIVKNLEKNYLTDRGVFLSTFHGLKGLEFNHGYLVDLEDSIFPNNKFVNQSNYDDLTKELLKQESVCLFYVAITRFKDSVTFLWNKENPSEYITQVLESEYKESTLSKENHVGDNRNFLTHTITSNESSSSIHSPSPDDKVDFVECCDDIDLIGEDNTEDIELIDNVDLLEEDNTNIELIDDVDLLEEDIVIEESKEESKETEDLTLVEINTPIFEKRVSMNDKLSNIFKKIR